MNLLFFYFKPQVLATLRQVLQETSLISEKDNYLDTWIKQEFPDPIEQERLRAFLLKIGAVEFYHYCGDWIRDFALAYDVQEEIGKDEEGQALYENFIKITPLGEKYIKTLYANYIQPTL